MEERNFTLDNNTKEIHYNALVVDAHHQLLEEFVSIKVIGGKRVFDNIYAPKLRQAGINFINVVVGGDHTHQAIKSHSDFYFWDTCKTIDFLLSEEEEASNSFIICRNAHDIDYAIRKNKIGVFMTLKGGRPLEGKPNLQLLTSLRTLYRMGLRSLQLTGNGRNRLADGVAQSRTRGGLTNFGLEVVKEAEHLKIILDTAQLSDYGFYDVIKNSSNVLIDSHSCAASVHNHPRNISNERIKAIADRNGVIGLSFWAALVQGNKETPDVKDLMKHIEHIVKLVGIDYVALGPNYSGFLCPVNRNHIKGYANLGDDGLNFDTLTPTQSEKYPGWIEGIDYGIRKSDYIKGPDQLSTFPQITSALVSSGFGVEDIRKILGGNFLRVFRQGLPSKIND
jgi:membrane dipeptidase